MYSVRVLKDKSVSSLCFFFTFCIIVQYISMPNIRTDAVKLYLFSNCVLYNLSFHKEINCDYKQEYIDGNLCNITLKNVYLLKV